MVVLEDLGSTLQLPGMADCLAREHSGAEVPSVRAPIAMWLERVYGATERIWFEPLPKPSHFTLSVMAEWLARRHGCGKSLNSNPRFNMRWVNGFWKTLVRPPT